MCTAVGYSSLGTFTTQFTRLVGMPPSRFKALLDRHGDRGIGEVVGAVGRPVAAPPGRCRPGQLTGRVTGQVPADGIVFTGLFPHGVPQDLPLACTVAPARGTLRLRPPEGAGHHILAVCFDRGTRVADALDDPSGVHRLVATTPPPPTAPSASPPPPRPQRPADRPGPASAAGARHGPGGSGGRGGGTGVRSAAGCDGR
ncbi:hypothetical protein ACQEVX_02340 [Streptomyces syringium]|uniref:hypothetical protein n=1 Tax=Streptomyces syringium TaxID=76729 RepID=UPI003D92980A